MFHPTSSMRAVAATFGSALLLAACGGGGGDSSNPAPAPAPTIQGTAATGAALAGADVAVTDASGNAACVETSIVTSSTGTYACTLQAGKAAPLLVVVTDPSGGHQPLVSMATATPAAGASQTVNATPLTTAIVAQLAPGADALNLAQNKTLVKDIDAAALAALKDKVLAQLAAALAAVDAPAGYDPFATPITAATASATGNAADRVLELLRLSTVDGVTVVATVDAPDAAVPLAGTAGSAAPLPAPSVAATTLADAMRLLAAGLDKCFAVPAASRIVARDATIPASAGGPEVLDAAAACDDAGDLIADGYLHNGYRAGQQLYGLLADANMDGAAFTPPEVMRLTDDTSAADRDSAIVNIRYVDRNGVAGNLVTVAVKFRGSATAALPTEWRLYGNQQPVDTSIRAFVRRNEQLAPNPGTAPFASAAASRYESGFNIFVNKDGPGSTGLRAVRVKGPGLPTAGLVLTRPDASICTDQNWLNILSKTGDTAPSATVPAPDNGNIFRLQRTQGTSGADATAARANPNVGNGNSTAFPTWAHPLDYGQAANNADFIDFTKLKANTVYTFEVYYVGETAPRHTLTKTMLTPVTPATRAASLRWVDLTAAARRYLDPADALAAATPTMNLSWTANPLAETILSAGVYTFNAAARVDDAIIGVARGAVSAVASAPGGTGCAAGTTFPALTSDGTSGRNIQLRYRMLDGSYKDTLTRYD